MLIADWHFLLLLKVPIQDRAQQLQIYEIFKLPVPHSNVSAQYEITNKYIGVTYDEIQAVLLPSNSIQHVFMQMDSSAK